MKFEDAMYNCLLRRATLVAFDSENEFENNYWTNSTYFQTAFDMGLELHVVKQIAPNLIIF
jgi:hypothetical protein